MNEEIANIKNVLKNVKGEMENKEQKMKEVMEDKVESEGLMEEIRYVKCFCYCVLCIYFVCLHVWERFGGNRMWQDIGEEEQDYGCISEDAPGGIL